MPTSFLSAPLLLAVLAGTPAVAQPALKNWDVVAARLVELTADNAGQMHEVGMSPHHPTTLVFNAPLLHDGVEVEDARRVAAAVNEASGMVMLLFSGVPPDSPLWLRVRFADEAVPQSATFRLVVRPTQAEQEVRVYRRARSAESFQQEARQEHERANQCESRLARTQAEQQRPGGLPGLFDARLLGRGLGIEAQSLRNTAQRPGETVQVQRAFSYRVEEGNQVAVELEVKNTGTQPWTVDGAARLVNKDGVRLRVLSVWPREPVLPGDTRQLVVEAEATEEQSRGTFVLELGEVGGPRTVTVRGVEFP